LRTRVGYCGGKKAKPTYHDLGDHTEAFSLDYDPEVVSYEDLLERFWNGHRCNRNNSSRQYMNAVFYRSVEQKQLAEASRDRHAATVGTLPSNIATEILPVAEFTYAEGYHHKYYLTRYSEIRAFLEQAYPSAKQLADSTVATRLNAYLGSGVDRDWQSFLAELPDYGLPEEIENTLQKTAESQLSSSGY